MLSTMIAEVAGKAPEGATSMLAAFKDVSWTALNSYVHGGIHPLRRHMDGFPVSLMKSVVMNSNGLSTMNGMLLANLTGDEKYTSPMSKIQRGFADCLPPVLD
ncbi:hypothetical protein D9M70_651600 [compost metagenome]